MPSGQPTPDLEAVGRPPRTDREKQIRWTRTGLRVLLLAVLLQWIPVIEYLGFTVGALGILYLLKGRQAFGRRYGILLETSVVLFAAAGLLAFAVDQDFGYAMDVVAYSNPEYARGVALAAFGELVRSSAAVAIVISASSVCLAFDLEDRDGRRLLLAGVAAQVVVSVALTVLVLGPVVQQAIAQAFSTSPADLTPLAAANAEINGWSALRLFDAIPAILFAGAYAKAWGRIDRGEIPPPETMQALGPGLRSG